VVLVTAAMTDSLMDIAVVVEVVGEPLMPAILAAFGQRQHTAAEEDVPDRMAATDMVMEDMSYLEVDMVVVADRVVAEQVVMFLKHITGMMLAHLPTIQPFRFM
jgi:hypothetical protein